MPGHGPLRTAASRHPDRLGLSIVPFTVSVHPDQRLAYALFTGHATGAEMLEACHAIVEDQGWQGGFDELWDFLDAPEVDVQPDEISALVDSAHRLADRLQPCRVGFVTRREPVALLIRLFELFTLDLGRDYRTFLTRGAASAWLGVSLEAIDA